jgi:hypothetical protein
MAKIIPLSRATKGGPPQLPDADIVVLLLLLAPVFVGVVARTIARGEVFGVGTTFCAVMAVVAVVVAAGAWRARRSAVRNAQTLRFKGERRSAQPAGGSPKLPVHRDRRDRPPPASLSAK